MISGSYIIMIKENDQRKFFLFDDGTARELLKNGWSNLILNFLELYRQLEKEGYTE